MNYELTWDADPRTEEQRVYRDINPIITGSLPEPIAILPAEARDYFDGLAPDWQRTYYRVSAIRYKYGFEEAVSREVSIGYDGGYTLEMNFDTSEYRYMIPNGDYVYALFDVLSDFTRPGPADYIDANGDTVTSPPDTPRFAYSEDGSFLGFQLQYEIDEIAVLNALDWLKEEDGAWVISGVFEDASLLGGAIQGIDGDSTVVMTRSGIGYDVYLNNYLIASDVPEPSNQGILQLNTGGNAYLKRLDYQPKRFTADEASAIAENRNLYLNSRVIILEGVS